MVAEASVHTRGRRITAIYALLESILAALLIYSLVGTYPLKILSAVSLFFLVLFFSCNFHNIMPPTCVRLPSMPLRTLVYITALLTSLVVVFAPSYYLHLDAESIWETFASLSQIALAKVVCTYFIVGFFPGYLVLDIFLKKHNFDPFESLCLVSTLSYIMTILTTLALHTFGLDISPQTFVSSIWVLAVLLKSIHYLKKRNSETELPNAEKNFAILDFEVAFLLLIGIVVTLFSYVQAFLVRPFGGYLVYDVPRYMIQAQEFMYFGPIVRAPYVWPQVFIWTTSRLSGLPMMYAYAGLQFYQIIYPFAFYLLLHTLFKKRELAIVGTFLLFFAVSTNALAPLWTGIMFPDLFKTYLLGDGNQRYVFLRDYYDNKLGTSLSFPVLFSPGSMNMTLMFASLTFVYRYLTVKNRRTDLLLAVLFTSATLYTHNIEMFSIILLIVIVFSLVTRASKRVTAEILGSIIVCVLFFDSLSRFYFIKDEVFRRLSPLIYSGSLIEVMLAQEVTVPIAGLIFCSLLMFLFRYFPIKKIGPTGHKALGIFDAQVSKLFLWLFSILTVLLAMFYVFANYASLHGRWTGPWYNTICTYYVLNLPLAIGGLPHVLRKDDKFTLYFILSWIASLLFGFSISFFSEEMYEAYFHQRYILGVILPFTYLSTLSLNHLGSQLESRHLPSGFTKTLLSRLPPKKILSLLLSLLITVSFASFAYTHDYGLVYPERLASSFEIQAYEWVNNEMPKDSVILPLSERSYLTLTSMVSGVRVLPIMWQYSSGGYYPYIWLKDLRVRSVAPEAVLWTLNRLNVSYIYATQDDLMGLGDSSALKSLLRVFPIIFDNDGAKVYSTLPYPLFEDSSYVLVDSTLDAEQESRLYVFNLLLASGTKFSVIPDTYISTLDRNYVYFFSHNQHLPHRLLENLSSSIYQGAHVVFFDPAFASFDELNNSFVLRSIGKLTGVVSAWSLDEGQGDKAHNHANESHGEIHGAVWAEGISSEALAFDGYDDWVELPQDLLSTSDFLNGGRIEFWFKAGRQESPKMVISIEGGWFVYLYPSGHLSFDIDGSSGHPSTITAHPYDDNVWHKATVIWDGGKGANAEIYIDGVREGSSVQDLCDIDLTNRTSAIGGQYDGSLNFNGMVDAVTISRNVNMSHDQLGHGTLTFIKSTPLSSSTREQAMYKQSIKDSLNYISEYLPEPNLPVSPLSLPFPEDLFNYIIPEFISLWHLKGLHGYCLSDYGTVIAGHLTVQSVNIRLVGQEITAKKLSIGTESGETILQQVRVREMRIAGDGVILSNSSELVLSGSVPGFSVNLHFRPEEDGELSLTNVKGEIVIEKNSERERIALSGENLTILTADEYSVLTEQPTIAVNGSLSSRLSAALSYGNRFFSTRIHEPVIIKGEFALKILYNSGLVLLKMFDIRTIDITEQPA